ncbi:MAG: hypothetical protein FJ276_24135 [Planctomycetes bacterium]|nr:hypothetical protein [Planctomycetota bacterium]
MPHSVLISGVSTVVHFYERPEIPMLFDLSKDMGEVENIATRQPDTHQKLHGEMMAYLKQVGARFPKVNPAYDPAAYKNAKGYAERAQLGPFEGKRPLEDDEKQAVPPTKEREE